MTTRDSVRARVAAKAAQLRHLALDEAGRVADAVDLLVTSFASGGKLLAFGNGGSAADAQHLVAELVGRLAFERRALPALALTTDTSVLTAIANDYGYDHVFSRQVEALGQDGDVVLAISTSGRSPNVLAGLRAARQRGLRTIALTGPAAGFLDADVHIVANGRTSSEIQEAHIVVEHTLCELVEARLYPAEAKSAAALPPAAGLLPFGDLGALGDRLRGVGQRIAWTNGVFDLLHPGHLHLLQYASSLGDVLVVGVNSDASTRRLKGPERPIVPAAGRAELVAGLACVDYVAVFEDDTPCRAIERLRPDVHVKDEEYRHLDMPERALVEAGGGRVEFCPRRAGWSTTGLVRSISVA